jgi:uncharacterized phage-associated protein
MEQKLFDIANYIINQCEDITNMKLQKLVYYAHAHFLVNHHKPLINSDIEAWIYGPVIKPLYQEFSKFSYNNITQQTPKGNKDNIDTQEKKALDYILSLYKDSDAGYLSDKTHSEDPWQDAYQSTDWSQNIITNESILAYYSDNPLK